MFEYDDPLGIKEVLDQLGGTPGGPSLKSEVAFLMRQYRRDMMPNKISLFKKYNIELTSLPQKEFNFNEWKTEIIQKFREIGFPNPEEEFERNRTEEGAIFWFPDKQDKPLIFFAKIHVEKD